MPTANPNYSFNVIQDKGKYTINWKAARLTLIIIFPLLVPTMALGLLIANFTSENNVSSFLSSFILWTAALIVGFMLLQNRVIRKGGQFSFTKEGFELNGINYDVKDIKGLYIKTPKGERESIRVHTTVHGFGVAGTMHNLGQGMSAVSGAAHKAIRGNIRNRSFKVCIQYGEREVVLARHLTEQTAKALISKIDELI